MQAAIPLVIVIIIMIVFRAKDWEDYPSKIAKTTVSKLSKSSLRAATPIILTRTWRLGQI